MLDDRAQQQQQQSYHGRLRIFGYAVVLLFGFVLFRFYHLQIIKGGFYRELSENNRLALIRTKAPRGIIFDRHRKVLVANRPSFRVSMVPEEVQDLEATVGMLVSSLDVDSAWLREAVSRVGRYRQFEHLTVKEDVPRDRLAFLESIKFQYPGVHLEVEPRRHYPEGIMAAHVVGYVGEISQDELEHKRGIGYGIGDFIGKMGVEREFDDVLKGLDGGLQVEVDSLGRRLRIINSQEPLPGYNLTLTIDRDIQKAAEDALGDRSGAVVAVDPNNGQVLAAVSHPAYDPNLFSAGLTSEAWRGLQEDVRHPMQNRVTQSQYPPGSVFKLITAVAGLQEGTVVEGTGYSCGGGMQFGDRYYRCWRSGGHGGLSLHRAITESCDSYFYHLGDKVGIDAIARYARAFGLGKATGVDLPGEWSGLVPDKAWKRKARGEPWYPGETLSAAIGQGYNLITPMQMVVMIAALANGGAIWRPMLVKNILSPDGRIMKEFAPRRVSQVELRPEVMAAVRRAMWGAVNEPGGTGGRARLATVAVAGKTGTAQVVKIKEGEGRKTAQPEQFRDHSWFGCFAPYGEATVALVAMVEHGGHGGSVSAPIAQKVLKSIFEKDSAAPEAPIAEQIETEEGD